MDKWSWHQAGNLRVQGSNHGSSRQPLAQVAKKIQQKYSLPYTVPLIIDFARSTLKDF